MIGGCVINTSHKMLSVFIKRGSAKFITRLSDTIGKRGRFWITGGCESTPGKCERGRGTKEEKGQKTQRKAPNKLNAAKAKQKNTPQPLTRY